MDRGADGGDASRLLAKLGVGVGFLTCNSAAAAYRSRGDPGAVAFVAVSYGALLLLLYFLGRFERARPGDDDRERGRAKAAVWALSTLLTAMFAARVAPLMPPAVGVGVWAVAAATAGGGFWALFVN